MEAREAQLRSPSFEVRLLNISEDGLAVETTASLRIGARYRFALQQDGESASFIGTVLWCRLRHTRLADDGEVLPVYRAGIARVDDERRD